MAKRCIQCGKRVTEFDVVTVMYKNGSYQVCYACYDKNKEEMKT